MPGIPRLPKQFPYRHLVMLFTVAVLLGFVATLDALLMEDFPWIDLAWALPIVTAAFLLSPLEVVGVGLTAMLFCLASQVARASNLSLWIPVAIGASGLLAAFKANLIRRYYNRISVIRDAIEDAPVAYAEFSFPGYKLLNHNETFKHLTGGRCKNGVPLVQFLPEEVAAEMAEKMDQAVSSRERVDCDEFHIPSAGGRSTFW